MDQGIAVLSSIACPRHPCWNPAQCTAPPAMALNSCSDSTTAQAGSRVRLGFPHHWLTLVGPGRGKDQAWSSTHSPTQPPVCTLGSVQHWPRVRLVSTKLRGGQSTQKFPPCYLPLTRMVSGTSLSFLLSTFVLASTTENLNIFFFAGHTHTKKLFIVHLKFKFYWVSCIFIC